MSQAVINFMWLHASDGQIPMMIARLRCQTFSQHPGQEMPEYVDYFIHHIHTNHARVHKIGPGSNCASSIREIDNVVMCPQCLDIQKPDTRFGTLLSWHVAANDSHTEEHFLHKLHLLGAQSCARAINRNCNENLCSHPLLHNTRAATRHALTFTCSYSNRSSRRFLRPPASAHPTRGPRTPAPPVAAAARRPWRAKTWWSRFSPSGLEQLHPRRRRRSPFAQPSTCFPSWYKAPSLSRHAVALGGEPVTRRRPSAARLLQECSAKCLKGKRKRESKEGRTMLWAEWFNLELDHDIEIRNRFTLDPPFVAHSDFHPQYEKPGYNAFSNLQNQTSANKIFILRGAYMIVRFKK